MVMDWYKDAIFYEVYIRAFRDSDGDGHGDIQGLIEKLDHIKNLGVDCIWVLPHYPSPLKDDGYDISDYYSVHSDYGTIEDFKNLVEEVHNKGIRIITDLVLNHTSDEHEWFRKAREDKKSPFRNFYVWSDSNQLYKEARIIFLDSEVSNWAWDGNSRQYYWHRFYSSQPDLNYDNPMVIEEMFKVVKFWLDIGVDGFRVDAIPYLYEREGTNCENLPETHAFLKRLRKFLDENYPDRILLSEANQWPEEVRPYFGDGDEVHMNFHFPLMPRIFKSLYKEEVSPIKEILARTPDIPYSCQWCTFLRNHDELTLEMVTEEDRKWMWEKYAPEKRMRLNLGIRRRLAPLLDNDHKKILLANSLLLTLPGSPVIYYGDEIGMGDNIWLKDRDGVRTPMQWNSGSSAGFSEGDTESFYSPVIDDEVYGYKAVNVLNQSNDPNSLLSKISTMISQRKKHPVFGRGSFDWVSETQNPYLVAYWRINQNEKVLVLNNLSSENQTVDLKPINKHYSFPTPIYPTNVDVGTLLTLEPHEFVWIDYSKDRSY